MTPLLYLVHRIPYPPNKGDKIRSYHILRYLRRRYRVYLGAFIDSEEDRAFVSDIAELCEEFYLPVLNPLTARIASLRGMTTGIALTLPYYYRRGMQNWVDRIIASHGIERTVVFSSAMAQYVSGSRYRHINRTVDFVDVDSDKWLQYSSTMRWPWNWIYRREGRTLLEFEAAVADEFDYSTFVSAAEAAHFSSLIAGSSGAGKVRAFANGVDTDHYDPQPGFANPYPSDHQVIVFTGAMDYWANVDAVCWFARETFPRIFAGNKNARFYIVGSRPTPRVKSLAGDGVVVTGKVADVRPWLAHASVAVAPLRIARGIQNKVLEAMAMALPVFTTPQAAEGINAADRHELIIEADPMRMAREINEHLADGKYAEVGRLAREFVIRNCNWEGNLSVLEECIEAGAASG